MQTRTYYDFDSHWPEFWAAWNTEPVQKELEMQMREWCEHKAYKHLPPWKRGDPLWKYGRTDYWATRIQDAADKLMDDEGVRKSAATSLARFGIPTRTPAYYEEIYEEICGRVEPKEGTPEWLILTHGEHYLMSVMYEVAIQMFPPERVHYADDACCVFVENEEGPGGVVFDLLSWYWYTRHG